MYQVCIFEPNLAAKYIQIELNKLQLPCHHNF